MTAPDDVYPVNLALVGGRRFWMMREVNPSHEEIAGAYATLAADFNPEGEEPIGLCVLLDDKETDTRAAAYWPDPPMIYVGFLPDGRQVRVGYFPGARIGEGHGPVGTDPPILVERDEGSWLTASGFRLALFGDQSEITSDDVLALWAEIGLPSGEAQRRLSELHLVAVGPHGGLAGVSTTYLARTDQLGLDMWYYRALTAPAHRLSNVTLSLAWVGRNLLARRFATGEDPRAPGAVYEVENEGLKRYFHRALWLPLRFAFIGVNARGDHVRVHYFPGARAPAAPGAAPAGGP